MTYTLIIFLAFATISFAWTYFALRNAPLNNDLDPEEQELWKDLMEE
jgi:hypothetical protein